MAADTKEPRPAKTADLPAIVTLLEGAGLPLQGIGATALWVAAMGDDGEAVGVVGLEVHGDLGLLRSLAVREDRRGAQIGRALVDHALTEAKKRRLHALYLLTTDASDYFIALGFVPTTRDEVPETLLTTVEFREACPESAQVMVIALDR